MLSRKWRCFHCFSLAEKFSPDHCFSLAVVLLGIAMTCLRDISCTIPWVFRVVDLSALVNRVFFAPHLHAQSLSRLSHSHCNGWPLALEGVIFGTAAIVLCALFFVRLFFALCFLFACSLVLCTLFFVRFFFALCSLCFVLCSLVLCALFFVLWSLVLCALFFVRLFFALCSLFACSLCFGTALVPYCSR